MQVRGTRPEIAQRWCVDTNQRAAQSSTTAGLQRTDVMKITGGAVRKSSPTMALGTVLGLEHTPAGHSLRRQGPVRIPIWAARERIEGREVRSHRVQVCTQPGLWIAQWLATSPDREYRVRYEPATARECANLSFEVLDLVEIARSSAGIPATRPCR